MSERSPEFAKILSCSTLHMSYNDSCKLSECPHLVVVEYPEGFFVHLDETQISDQEFCDGLIEWGLSRELVKTLQDAVRWKCGFIRFDADAPTCKWWPCFDW